MIADYHKVDVATLKSIHDLGDADQLEDMSTEFQEQIVSTRVRVGRTVKGYPMAAKLTREVNICRISSMSYLRFGYSNICVMF